MPRGPIRRGQLIAPFGVGAMTILRDGTSVIGCGLDHWYQHESSSTADSELDLSEFKLTEWRLERRLGIDHFRLPPDYRKPIRGKQNKNVYLTLPYLRFPQTHFCPQCHLLREEPLSLKERPKCPECATKGKNRWMWQVPIVAMCEHGHLTDFPWREWVHRSSKPKCDGDLRLIGTGGASLAAQEVRCDKCHSKRSLDGVTSTAKDNNSSVLTENLESDAPFLCQGAKPWLHLKPDDSCGRPIRGTLRSASNVYYPQIESAIYLPRASAGVTEELREALEDVGINAFLRLHERLGEKPTADDLRTQNSSRFEKFTDDQLYAGIELIQSRSETEEATTETPTGFRFAEYRELLEPQNAKELVTKVFTDSDYRSDFIRGHFERIVLIERLRETRALSGFTRILPHNDQTRGEMMALLRRKAPKKQKDNWLPAYVVYGEGILFQFSEARVLAWLEARPAVLRRVGKLWQKFQFSRLRSELSSPEDLAKLVLVHTFSHVLMNRLSFECGYSTAALRERLYVSSGQQSQMMGVLIYTAAGDAEGTLGGLVRMGRPDHLEQVLERAIQYATWCSADPICMEAGEMGGQGPESCNLSACHNCALVPETACEEFNRFVDRGLLVGNTADTTNEGQFGYFSEVL